MGLVGAVLGRLTGRRMTPLALALACAVSAEVFNLVVDLYTWTGTGSKTLAGFGLVLGQASVFDITHVIASFAFGLAFGGVLLRMLMRVRSRLQVSWEPAGAARLPGRSGSPASLGVPPPAAALLLAIAGLAIGVPAAARAMTTAHRASVGALPATLADSAARVDIAREVAFLAAAQNPDGGFGSAQGQTSSELYTAWVAIGLAAAGRDPLSLRRDGHTVLDALRGEASTLEGAGDLERTILALHACGVSVRSLPGGDPVARLLRFRAGDGSFGHLSNVTAFAVLALRAAGYSAGGPIVRGAARWLERQQEADGGFGFAGRGGGSDVDDTAAVVQALVQAGVREGPILTRASSFITSAQNLDGGFPEQPGGQSNAQSTAWAIQGLIAAGRNPATVTRAGSRSPLGYLESLIAPDGSVRYSRTGSQTPVWVTAQALTALAGTPLPIAPVAVGAARSTATSASYSSPQPRHTGARSARRPTDASRAPAAQASGRDGIGRALGALLGVARALTVFLGSVLAPAAG